MNDVEQNNNTGLRVYFLILGTNPWTKEVSSPEEARSIIDTIANFVNFQVDNHVFPDHCSTAGLEMWDEDSEEWVDWYDDEGFDFEEHFEQMELESDADDAE